MPDDIPALRGAYLLVFKSDTTESIAVGRMGLLEMVTGYYLYVGSAFGSGGLRARVRHHCGVSQRPHWHLDYIRPRLSLHTVWYSTEAHRLEHAWADSMYYTMQMPIPMPGLGATDCKCNSHFFYSEERPDEARLHKALSGENNITVEMLKII